MINFTESFFEKSQKDIEQFVYDELKATMYNGYMARFTLYQKMDCLKMMGHETPFERIGEIINEFEHWINYTMEDNPGRYFYQDIIDDVLEYYKKNKSCVGVISFDFMPEANRENNSPNNEVNNTIPPTE